LTIATEELLSTLLARNRARASMEGFSLYIAPDEPPALHHRLLCAALDEVMEGNCRRLIVCMPPGSAKSTFASVRFPAYFLGKYPKQSIICASYGEGLSTSFGRKVRNIVDSRDYSLLFKTKLSEDSRAKGEWETNDGGSYFAAGVGSGITGRRGFLGLIDDPVRGRKDADSEGNRNETWEWYRSDFVSRLKPGASQVVISTRWHEDDLTGRILPKDWNGESGEFIGFDNQVWTVICIPAQARERDILGRQEGEWLWTEWFTPSFWEETKKIQTSTDLRNWNALYQQIPQPDSGTFFQRDWFKRFRMGDEPKALSRYGASDYAVSEGKGDFTELGVGGFDIHEDLYFTDWWSGQKSADVWIDAQLDLVKKHEPFAWFAEGGPIRRSVEPFLEKRKRERSVYVRTEWINTGQDKAANARGFQAIAASGKVYIPYTEWGEELLNQLVRFIPNTNFRDDKVDVCGLFGRILDKTFGPVEIQTIGDRIVDSYHMDEEFTENWKVM
jgi:hypothetical protein